MSDSNYDLRPVWKAVIDVYTQFKNLCEKHQLRYFVIGGTLLGAVRHKGFIPWDDDFDVGMPRPDYDKFLSLAAKELPDFIKIVNRANTPEFTHEFSKLQDVRKDCCGQVEAESGLLLPQGIFVDVFPMDGVATNPFKVVWMRMKFFALHARSRACNPAPARNVLSLGVIIIGKLLALFYGRRRTCKDFYEWNQNILRSIPFDSAKLCAYAYTYRKNIWFACRPYLRKWIGSLPKVPFESMLVPVPESWHDYLTSYYGDYMMPPPAEQRRLPHHNSEPVAPWKFGPTYSEL